MNNTHIHISDELQQQLEKAGQAALLLTDCRGAIERDVMDRWLEGSIRGTGVDPRAQLCVAARSQMASNH